MLLTLALAVLGVAGLLPASLGMEAPALISVWGMMLSVACLVQFWISLAIDRRYEPAGTQPWRTLGAVIWYPVAFWMLSAFATVVGFPRAVLRQRGRRARWTSPDRGFR
jgi:biofilm PGA synthesis N-glycosyltransferase PgaC